MRKEDVPLSVAQPGFSGDLVAGANPSNPFDSHEYSENFLRRFYDGERAAREAQLEALERAEGVLADLEEELREQAGALGLTREEWEAAMANPNFTEIYGFCIENPNLTWAEARAKWAAEEEAADARWDQRLDLLNRQIQSKIPPKGLQRLDRAEGRRRSHRRRPTKTDLLNDPKTIKELRLGVARDMARQTRATATDEEVAEAINHE